MHAHDHGTGSGGPRRALAVSLGLTVAFGVGQVVAGVAFDSLALLADAVHNVSDGAALALALGAAHLAGLPARGARTFGWKRAEVLAALLNAVALVAVSLWVVVEAVRRLDAGAGDPLGVGVVAVGLAGVVLNGVPVVLIRRAARRDDLNARAAMLHAASDVLGSAATVVAGLVVALTGWAPADPIIGALIGVGIALSARGVLVESVRILLESAPAGLDPDAVGRALVAVPGVREVHDLHVWTITSGFPALSAHAVVDAGTDADRVLHELEAVLRRDFGIEHATLQVDRDHARGLVIHRPGCPAAAPRTAPLPGPHEGHAHP